MAMLDPESHSAAKLAIGSALGAGAGWSLNDYATLLSMVVSFIAGIAGLLSLYVAFHKARELRQERKRKESQSQE